MLDFCKFKKHFLTLTVLFIATFLYGREETYSSRYSSSDFSSGISMEVMDGRYFELGSGSFLDKGTNFILKLGIDERSDYDFLSAHTFSISATIRGYDSEGDLVSTDVETLSVSYSPVGGLEDERLSYFETTGGYRYEVEVSSITAPDNVYLEGELTVDRYYPLDIETVPTVSSLGCNYVYYDETTNAETVVYDVNGGDIPTLGQELEIWWDYIEGAESYELEWTWVDNYGNSGGSPLLAADIDFSDRDFELNNTRIITTNQRYRIPLIYKKGYLIYRVRAVGVWTDESLSNTLIRKYGKWTTDGTSISSVADYPHKVRLTTVHEALKNWQYQAVYAEEGKKKEIISYFDGSLRNRQTVTRINSNEEAIVGENVYDNQGRSAIQILPTPVDNTALRYYPELNLNATGSPYSHNDFDWDTGECISEADPMNTESGAANYYTNDMTDRIGATGDWQDYVPDAGGHPFVQVQYTPDNTGRIRSQSGVGSDFTLDGDHATRYYYLQARQEELNRLFGYQVGYKSRYKKNLVVDANGQVSISYLDPQGRVVATALAGDNTTGDDVSTASLLSLESEEDLSEHLTVTADLLNKYGADDTDTDSDDNELYSTPTFSPTNDALRLNTQTASTDDGTTFDYTYRARTGVYEDECDTDDDGIADFTLAYPYAYELTVDITDDCGTSVLLETGETETGALSAFISGTSPDSYATATGTDVTKTFTATLNKGAYTVSKILKIDADKLDEYAAHYMENNSCLLNFEDFLENTVDCPDTLGYEFDEITTCYVTEHMLLGDVSPMGQYGAIDGVDLLSVFTETNGLDRGKEAIDHNWKYPTEPEGFTEGDEYYEADGSVSYITHDGESKTVTQAITDGMDLETFLSHWRESWALSLIDYHPEYGYKTYQDAMCDVTGGTLSISSENYNNTLTFIDTYDDATSTSNALGADLVGDPYSASYPIKTLDPYYVIDYTVISGATDGGGHTLKQGLLDITLGDYLNAYSSPNMNLWDFSVRTVLCGADLDGDCTLPTTLASLESVSYTDEQRDQIWNTYKNLYLAEKRKIDQLFIDMYGLTEGCYNGYIGTEAPEEPYYMAFSDYPEFIIPFITGTGSGYSGDRIVTLYEEAKDDYITAAGGALPFPWTAADYTDLFTTKTQRYIRIDNLYDAGVPGDDMLEEMAEEVDGIAYEYTGKCAYLVDVEALLNGMAADGYLAPTTTTASELIPAFSSDLYAAMGGTVLAPGATGTAVSVSSGTVVGGIEITANNADGTGTLSSSIVLNTPTGLGWTWSWADVEGFEMAYYEPGSLSGGVYPFEILAIVDVAGSTEEVVITGETEVAIGECDYDPTCDRADMFAQDLAALYYQLYNDSKLGAIITAENLVTHIGDWYNDSELQEQLMDFGSAAEIKSTTSDNIYLVNTGFWEMSITFSAGSGSLNIENITGSTFNKTTGVVTIYYVDSSDGATKTFTGTVVYRDISSTPVVEDLDLDCDCEYDQMEELEVALLDVCNYVVDGTEGSDYYYLNPIEELTALIPFLDYTNTEIYGDDLTDGIYGLHAASVTTGGLVFKFQLSGGCSVELSRVSGETADVTDVVYFSELDIVKTGAYTNYEIYAIGVLADGSTVKLESAQAFCFEPEACTDCVPQLVAPVSCNEAWSSYDTDISTKNGLLAVDDEKFPEYTEEELCATNLAYAVDDYLYYLTTLSISSPADDYYQTLSSFTLTDLQMGFEYDDGVTTHSMEDVIDDYETYVTDPTDADSDGYPDNEAVSWTEYVNTVWLDSHDVCPPAPMFLELDLELDYPCEQFTANVDTVNAMNDYATYLENTEAMFRQAYIEGAISSVIENFDEEYPDKEYHYTLYYYDQAGNLVQTVPPAGVDRIDDEINESEIKDARATNDDTENVEVTDKVLPDHTYQTQYHYNSLNQLVWQETPDGGESYFGYDELGRLVVSQNAKQKEAGGATEEQFSYTRYDGLGRIIEVGEMTLDGDYGFDDNGRFIDPSLDLVAVSASDFPHGLTDLVSVEEVTRTKYDELIGISATYFEDYASDNTRNRITGVYYYEDYDDLIDDFSSYDNATFYDYDVHGNVKELIQKINDDDLLALSGVSEEQTKKKVAYEYDLVSGNVQHVTYQKDEDDQFIHEYEYDADNRITNVRTSNDNVIWEQDAKYFYYDHGPLARSEIGDQKVAANDYAYTIQGWLKGVNSEDLAASNDQGNDSQTGMNRMSGKDVYGYSLHYYANDYKARHGNDFLAYSELATAMPTSQSLFNGNIRQMYTAASGIDEANIGTNHTVYQYDQLNRIKEMEQELLTGAATPVHTSLAGNYASEYTYDANGNLETLKRWADVGGTKTSIDNFTYNYNTATNQLNHVDDSDGEVITGVDLAHQDIDNYTYTEIGELLTDDQEEIADIQWKVTGKVHKIIRKSTSTKSNLEFVYDAMGNRIMKIETQVGTDYLVKKTYYIRDAQGNVMSIYTLIPEAVEETPAYKDLQLTERSIYGSSRIGTENIGEVIASTITGNIDIDTDKHQIVGDKHFELSNHLGNVLQVVTDRKLAIETSPGSGVVDYYVADVVSQSDYFPFGMVMPGRNESGDEYRYGFNGMEKDDEVSGDDNSYDFGARFYNPRVGRWLSGDPAESKHPEMSTYTFVANSPLVFIDPDGKDYVQKVTYKKDDNGTIISKEVSVTLKVKVINLTDENINYIHADNQKKASSKFDYSTAGMVYDEATGSYIDVPTNVNVAVVYEEVDNITQVTEGDNVLLIVDNVSGSAVGIAEDRGNVMAAELEYARENGDKVIIHETAHLLGISDNYEKNANHEPVKGGDPGKGLMGSVGTGFGLTLDEKKQTALHDRISDAVVKEPVESVGNNVREFADSYTNADPECEQLEGDAKPKVTAKTATMKKSVTKATQNN